MMIRDSEIEMLKRFLLGEVSSEEVPLIEEKLLFAEECYDCLIIAEDELIDELFLEKEIPAERKRKLNQLFNSNSEYKLRVAMAKTLHEISQTFETDERSVIRKIRDIFQNLLKIRYEVVR